MMGLSGQMSAFEIVIKRSNTNMQLVLELLYPSCHFGKMHFGSMVQTLASKLSVTSLSCAWAQWSNVSF